MTCLASGSGSVAAQLPSPAVLQTWVHRPQAIAKCTVSDVYVLQALVPREKETANRDIFLLNQFPCKMVELVGWVAGVDDKESSLTILLDDGDGNAVLPVRYQLPRVVKPVSPKKPVKVWDRSTFVSAKDRKAELAAEADKEVDASFAKRPPAQLYQTRDIRVGDIVRVVGKVDEYARRKPTGLEWVRGVTVEEGAGGRVEVVDADQQYLHLTEVIDLHNTVYCQPFVIPSIPVAQTQPLVESTHDMSLGYSFSSDMDTQSEMPSEITVDDDNALPDIRKLRSTQLNDNTFRRYLLDHMTEEVRSAALNADIAGPATVDRALQHLFPEYKPDSTGKGKGRSVLSASFSPNIQADPYGTPRAMSYKPDRPSTPLIQYPVYTISCLLDTPHLAELAGMIIDAESKKEERRRRKRVLNGEATEKDLALEREGSQRASGKVAWRLTGEKRRKAMERMVSWALRAISEEGSCVHVHLDVGQIDYDYHRTPTASITASAMVESTAYTPLPPPFILPVILWHLQVEQEARRNIFYKKTDPRWKSGMTIEELVYRMRQWGEEGRWERLGEWRVEEGVQWGLIRGLIRQEGRGYWAVHKEVAGWGG